MCTDAWGQDTAPAKDKKAENTTLVKKKEKKYDELGIYGNLYGIWRDTVWRDTTCPPTDLKITKINVTISEGNLTESE